MCYVLTPGGRRLKDQIRAERISPFIAEESAYKDASSVESISLVAGEPMGRHAAVQGWPFALVHAYAANTHQCAHEERSISRVFRKAAACTQLIQILAEASVVPPKFHSSLVS